MAKQKGNTDQQQDNGTAPATTDATAVVNHELTYRREHPGNRCSYGVPGNPGIVVFDRNLFADPSYNGPITLSVAMAAPKADQKEEKARLAAERAAERARKAEERAAAQAAKVKERAEKAAAQLKAAQEKVAAAGQSGEAASGE